ncbi:CHAT domain-containing protein [Streptomyces sp. NPDC057877]|uniref:CHAT domain-containing protein n=1 Tax=Streptomyces sp. NPDC057877 TaxID=3346269 RepID=UPI0036A657C1
MSGEPQRGARWLSGAGSMVRRAALPALRTANRRDPAEVVPLRRPHEPPSGTGSGAASPYARLENGLAVLRVVRAVGKEGEKAYRLDGWCGDLTVTCVPGPTRLVAPAVSLSNVRREGEYPSETLRAIQWWSDNQAELGRWINLIRARHGRELSLLVWDDTGYELPWELFWVPGDARHGLDGGPLGALLVMARWLNVGLADYDLPRRTADCHGRVLGYLHKDMADDRHVFTAYESQLHQEMTPFLRALDTPSERRTGLVYLGCHGTYGTTVSRLSLGDRTWAEFNGEDMRVLRTDGALVCLNACHSGRFVDNRAQGEHALRGFAELFLRKGAGGCVATAGGVGDPESRVLVRRLVHEMAAHPRHSVPETLRFFRASAVREFGSLAAIPTVRNDDGQIDQVGQKRVLRLLYAFMFHYYGHPETVLHLVTDGGPRTGKGAGGER